ncbi:MAG: hypothetical protein ACE5HF_01570 [Gemmatimonadota bacterium]
MNGHEQSGHLGPERLEDLVAGRAETRAPAEAAHLDACAECRRDLAALAGIAESLGDLPAFAPRRGFADRVMARVSLPVPWRIRVWRSVRERWIALTAGLAAAGASTVATVAWLGTHPGVTPGGVLSFLGHRGLAAAWSATREAGRFLFDSGIAWSLRSLIDSMTVPDALIALATLAVMGMGALVGLRNLLTDAPALVARERIST